MRTLTPGMAMLIATAFASPAEERGAVVQPEPQEAPPDLNAPRMPEPTLWNTFGSVGPARRQNLAPWPGVADRRARRKAQKKARKKNR